MTVAAGNETFFSQSPEETIEFGRRLAARLKPPVLVLLSGELGAGKTTLTKGIVSALGGAREEDVTSPTFTLVHVFQQKAGEATRGTERMPAKIYHVDLYRVEEFRDLETLALEDALAEPAIVVIEWSERFKLRSDWPRVVVQLEHADGDTRRITVAQSE